uniref:Cystatin domain-containing protein n=1 Tax=Strongyloides stercoralis TaxID=6248 RepID=A0A0K0EAG6_STRER
MIGGWSPLDLNLKEVQNLGIKVVEKYNLERNDKIKFNKVVNALQQMESKINYRLIVKVTFKNNTEKSENIRYLDANIYQQPETNTENINIEVLKPIKSQE